MDEFLDSRPTFQDFLRFDREIRGYRTHRQNEEVGDLLPEYSQLSLSELADPQGSVTSEVYRRLDELLPPEREKFFLLIAERAAWTGEDVSPRERSAGWGTLDDFMSLAVRERRAYRERFGV